MATVSRTADDPLAVSGWDDTDSESKSERYLVERLAAARAEVKGVALTTFGLAAAVAGMLWLIAGVLVEHWLVPGGLPAWARWTWLALAAVGLIAAAIRWVLPLVRYRVNLVYAARAIEREHPELHNDVVNAVLARARADETTPFVVRSLRRRAARQLSKVPGDGVMDRTLSLRLAAALAGLVVAAVVYELAAPKSLLASTARLVAPWLGISAPSRVWIDQPALAWRQPGAPAAGDAAQGVPIVQGVATIVRGRQLVVTVQVRGLADGEKPTAVVTPRRDGGAGPAWEVALTPAERGRFSACLPDASRGLDQSIDLVVAAGDARTEPIRVAVVDTPSLLVREVTYHYPKYTGQADDTVEWQGDLRAVEGTTVTLVAESNHPLESAWVDFGGDGKTDVPLKGGQRDLARVRGSFTLRLDAERHGAEHASYRLMFQPKVTSPAGREPPVVDRMEYRIDVVPDLGPEVSVTEPSQKVTRVPPGAPVTIRVKATDPDYGLASVLVETRLRGGPERQGRNLFAADGTSFLGDETLVPEQLGAGPGAVLEYRAVARDNRPERPNMAASEWQSLVIDASAPPHPAPPPKPEQGGDRGRDEQPGQNGSSGDEASEKGPTGADGKHDAGEQRSGAGKDSGGGRDDKPGAGDRDGQDRDDRGQKPRDEQPEAAPERPGGRPQKSADDGQPDAQQPKSRANDPKPARQEGQPEQGEDQGAADGGKPQDGMKGKTGGQAGQRQQDGSSDGAGSQPQGKGGAGQSGEQQGGRPDGKEGAGGQRPEANASKSQGGGGKQGAKPSDADGGGDAGRPDGQRGKGRGGDAKRETVASDGTDDGEAMERILEHRRKSEQAKQGGGEQSTQAEDGAGKAAQDGGKQDGGKQDGGKQDGGKQDGGKQDGGKQDGKNPAGQEQTQQPPACAGADGKPCGKEGCSSCSGGQGGKASGGGSGSGQAGGGQPGAEQGQEAGRQGKPSGKESGANDAGQAADEASEGSQAGGASKEGGAGSAGAAAGKGGEPPPAAKGTGGSEGGQPQEGKGGGGRDEAGQDTGAGGQEAGGPDDGASGKKPADGKSAKGDAPGSQAATGEAASGERSEDASNGDQNGAVGAGGRLGGGDRQEAGGAAGERRDQPMQWSEQDLSHAKNAADLAIEHLEKAVESGDTAVLGELGWTAEQAREFLARWERMRQAAAEGDPKARGEFDQAVKSLGMRPGGVRSARDVPTDVKGGQAEGRRSRPPSDYREQFKAFMQGAAPE
jgi:hypothetical protein